MLEGEVFICYNIQNICLFNIGNIFLALQNATDNGNSAVQDYYTFTGTGTIIVAIFTAGSLIYTILQDKKTRLLEFVKDVDSEIAEHLKKDEDLRTRDECVTHAYVYLEILDRIAFLLEKKKIPKLFSDYYKNFFNYGITMMLWYVYAWQDMHTLEDNWPSLIKWFKKNGAEPDDKKKGVKPDDKKKGLNPYPSEHLPSKAYQIIKILGGEEALNEKINNIIKTKRIDQKLIDELNEKSRTEVNNEENLEEEIEREEIRKEILKKHWRDEENKSDNQGKNP